MSGMPLDGTKAFGGEYNVIRPDETLLERSRNQYWSRVKEVLRQVFNADEAPADGARRNLEKAEDGKKTFQDLQVIFYHASPLEVAADLAGYKGQQLTAAQKAKYGRLLESWSLVQKRDRPPVEDLAVTHPEA
jgi:hypothetical protein